MNIQDWFPLEFTRFDHLRDCQESSPIAQVESINSSLLNLLYGATLNFVHQFSSVKFSSIAQSCLTLCDPMDCSTPGLTVHHQLPAITQTRLHWVSDAIQPSHPLSSPSPLTFNLYQHQGLFQWVSSSHQVAEVLQLKLLHQSFQWIFRTDYL